MAIFGRRKIFTFAFLVCTAIAATSAHAQDWVHTGSNLGQQKIRLAAADFKRVGRDPQTATLAAAFDSTLMSDLSGAGIFDMVSKSMVPQAQPGSPQEINLAQWAAAPANASMVAFGALSAGNGKLTVFGFVEDAGNPGSPAVLSKQYTYDATADGARAVAHKFADEIIARLGGGIAGIAETKIYFISSRSGNKEVWVMDYDGQNQHQLTHNGTVTLSPRISPDGSRLAFTSMGPQGWAVNIYSFELNRFVSFPAGKVGALNQTSAWSPDGAKVAFSSSRSGDPEIWLSDATGGAPKRLTNFRGPDVAPTFNPRTGSQIAWVSGRTGLPQIYTMDLDGGNVQRLTDGGYAISPSWSPNGAFLTFSWNRKYGPGAPGGQDIYVMDIASLRWVQLTHESGTNDFPSWSPDGRHIVFERAVGGRGEIWTMLADGTEQHQLTHEGANFMPNWSWK